MPASRRALRSTLLLPLAGLLLSACRADGPTEPPPLPGGVTVAIASPFGAEGAAVLEVVGGGWSNVVRGDSLTVVERGGEPGRLLLVRLEPGELRFRMDVENVHRPPRINVLEVADGENHLRASVSGYTARFTTEP